MEAPQKSHPTDQTLRAYGVGKLDDTTAESVNKHLESCLTCRSRVAELTSDSFVGRLRVAQRRPDAAEPVVSSLAGLSMVTEGSSASAPPPASTLPPGLVDHPDYEILRELGRGGMGVVYMAQNKLMGRMEVLKVVSSHLVNRRGVPDRFLTEIRNAAKLHHTNVVTAYSALRLGESLVLAMQYVEGLDLARLITARGPLPVAHACNYVHQAALGLQHAHDHGMVHRGIKPSNLMLAREGSRAVIKVLDFGLAKVKSEGPTDGTLTQDGQMLGTPDFIAPEQIRNARGADIRADIYSLGCTLYYLLSGGPPFHCASLYDILQAHHSMDAKPLNLARPEVPVELAALVAKMMAKEPERRFQEPKEVAQALKPFFTKANSAPKSTTLNVSQSDQPASDQSLRGTAVALAHRTTGARGLELQLKKPAEPANRDVPWESLIGFREEQRLNKPVKHIDPARRRIWKKWHIAVATSMVGLVALGGIIITIRDKDGREISKVTVPDGGSAVIEDSPGKSRVSLWNAAQTTLQPVGVWSPGRARAKLR
jgi:serine/threonine protein kinase